MGQKTYPKKTVEAFFKSRGLVFVRKGRCHDLWDNPDNPLSRKCTLRCKGKEVPLCHIHTNCVTMGLMLKDFKSWLKGQN
jgi:hypothetical protein